MALIRPRVINTPTANPVVHSEAAYGSFRYMLIYYFHFYFTIMILYIMMSFVFMALLKAASESYLYTLQNTAIAGPGQKGMRGDITWLV